VHSATVIPRLPASFASCRGVALFALAAVGCLVLAACSPGADYPSLFPAIHEIPPPRTDTTLDPNQVQQATEDLISARDRLSAGAQGAQSNQGTQGIQGKNAANSAVPAAKSGTNGGAKPGLKPPGKAASTSTANPAAARKPPNNQAAGRPTLGSDAEATASTETK
jgi:hypothetical protein